MDPIPKNFVFRQNVRSGKYAFTVMELMIVVAVIALLAGLWLTASNQRREAYSSDRCLNSLKNFGIANRVWEGDHNDLYPPRFFTNLDGTLKFAVPSETYRYFQVLSNELNLPQILICRADDRKAADDFASLKNTNISYFVSLDADETRPAEVLAGDRNLAALLPTPGKAGLVSAPKQVHNGTGNILLSDGSVQRSVSPSRFRRLWASQGVITNRLAVP